MLDLVLPWLQDSFVFGVHGPVSTIGSLPVALLDGRMPPRKNNRESKLASKDHGESFSSTSGAIGKNATIETSAKLQFNDNLAMHACWCEMTTSLITWSNWALHLERCYLAGFATGRWQVMTCPNQCISRETRFNNGNSRNEKQVAIECWWLHIVGAKGIDFCMCLQAPAYQWLGRCFKKPLIASLCIKSLVESKALFLRGNHEILCISRARLELLWASMILWFANGSLQCVPQVRNCSSTPSISPWTCRVASSHWMPQSLCWFSFKKAF